MYVGSSDFLVDVRWRKKHDTVFTAKLPQPQTSWNEWVAINVSNEYIHRIYSANLAEVDPC